MSDEPIMRGAEPFFLPGNDIGKPTIGGRKMR